MDPKRCASFTSLTTMGAIAVFCVAAAGCGAMPDQDKPTSTTHAALGSGNSWRLEPTHSGMRWDIEGASTSSGARLIQWPSNHQDNQMFSFSCLYLMAQNRTSCTIKPVPTLQTSPQQCIDIQSTDWGANVIQANCVRNSASQDWTEIDYSDFTFTYQNRLAGLCMDVQGASLDAGAPIILWGCSGDANQRFEGRFPSE